MAGEERPTVEMPTERPHQLLIRIDRRRTLWWLVGVVVVIVAVVLAARIFNLGSILRNPFGERTIDRSGPVLLESIRDLSRYDAASGNFQVVIDLEKDAKFIPSAVAGQRTLFVAAGTVDAFVEFGGLTDKALTVSTDRTAVTIKLPHAALDKTNLDHQRSYIVAEQRGILDRLRSLFTDDPNRQAQLYVLAENKIQEAAKQSELAGRAEKNTHAMLNGMLRSLGYTQITVTFGEPAT